MSVLPVGIGSASSSYQIANSVRFRSSASAYFSRTFGAPTSQTTWTWSGWVKGNSVGTIFSNSGAGTGTTNTFTVIGFGYYNTGSFGIRQVNGVGTITGEKVSTALFRDPTAWYHFVVVWDTSNGTVADRIRIYVNGQRITSFAGTTDPSSSLASYANTSGWAHYLSANNLGGITAFENLLAEQYFIDGQALTPSSFGEQNSDGVWVPKKYTGTYGNNGFYLKFNDGTSATTLGYDRSGNSNNWTPSGISTTAGVTYDWLTDTPTNNYCTLSPFQNALSGPLFTISDGGLNYSCSALVSNAGRMLAKATQALGTGKHYFEVKGTSTNGMPGICTAHQFTNDAGSAGSLKFLGVVTTTQYISNSSATYSGTTFTWSLNDILGFAWDGTAMTLACYRNNSLIGTFSGIESTESWFPAVWINSSSNSTTAEANFGQRPFTYTPPTGYKALCTANLPSVAITNPRKHFDVAKYTGNGGTQSITQDGNGNSLQLAPDFAWIKRRDGAEGHALQSILNTVVANGYAPLCSNNTSVEYDNTWMGTYGSVSSFNSNGITVKDGSDASVDVFNGSSDSYVAWLWKANGAGASGTGSNLSNITYSANQTAGFSIVKYTGSASNGYYSHGLNAVPKFIITKALNDGTNEWVVYHVSIGNTNALRLNLPNAQIASGAWNNTTPDSTYVYTGGGSLSSLNGSTNHISYVFAEIAGFSKFGSYVGNGNGTATPNTDGTYVHLGFRPRWIMGKRSTGTADDWWLYDTARDTYNPTLLDIRPNASNAEGVASSDAIDVTAFGFKVRGTTYNTASETYIYAAFAEYPNGSNVAPAPAR